MNLLPYAEYLKMNESDLSPILVDTRMPMFARGGRVENSVIVTVQNVIREGEFGAHLAPDPIVMAKSFADMGIDSTHPVVLTGDYTDPTMMRIAWTLEYAGHPAVYCISESIALLRKNGVKMTDTVKNVPRAKFEANPNESILIDAKSIQSSDSTYVIDARSLPEYTAGHIPSAILIPHTSGLGNAGMHFMNTAGLEKLFTNVPRDKEICCYCMHGTRASSLFYQLRLAGFKNVRLYDGSFVQWHGLGLALD
ncbi:MAG: rhodanese-like protein [Cenarchaeum symbiont of Oopsacas minuta]|nr:rhodanese-like protein [Cenarchaeum symbiont of Oopsacas minuta]